MVCQQHFSLASGAKILVTGAGGFIGSQLTEVLLKNGCQVWAIDSLDPFYSPKLKLKNIRWSIEHGLSFKAIDLAFDDLPFKEIPFDYIFHLAAQPGLDPQIAFSRYLASNVSATERLMEFALQQKQLKLFIQVSTSSVYGKIAVQSEEAMPRPISPYGVTKLSAEQVALSKWRTQGVPVSVFRLFSVYGPRERPDKLFPRIFEALRGGERLPLRRGSSQHRRAFTYVEDVVNGLMSAIGKEDRLKGEILNFGSTHDHSIEEAINIIQEIWGAQCEFTWVDPVPGDPHRTKAHTEKAKLLLSYEPKISLREGLERQIDWVKRDTSLQLKTNRSASILSEKP